MRRTQVSKTKFLWNTACKCIQKNHLNTSGAKDTQALLTAWVPNEPGKGYVTNAIQYSGITEYNVKI